MKETKFIISLTTLPERLTDLHLVLESLCNQNYSNYEVHLNISNNIKIDYSLFPYKNLKIFFIEDIGAISKLYYTLRRITDDEQHIITVDDDFIYHNEMLQEYNKIVLDYQNEAIGFAGIYPIESIHTNINGTFDFVGPTNIVRKVGVLEGYKSVCYKRKFFKDDFFKTEYNSHFEDDLVISNYLGKHNISKICIPYTFETDYTIRLLSFPLVKPIVYPKSGVNIKRSEIGGSLTSYQSIWNNVYFNGIKK
jgi:hypothetical protein